ncbi:MAG: discoidin domain-containing protein [Verrucomicrobiales bacterium]|nr:discoidin domain-containing protein [Verrucomicrobiales bacterium]
MKSPTLLTYACAIVTAIGINQSSAAEPPLSISGIYPHLTMRNDEGECGTGAVVPWQGSLWAITYAPHRPTGSSDKLYEVTPDLTQKIFDGSVGGTPANRMIHRETNQLLIGPYLIDSKKAIRVLPSSKMFGRLTGNARHLTDPAKKAYYATMEEGLYEVDLTTLEVTCLIRDNHDAAPKEGIPSDLAGYHGKGLYSSQGRLVYSNNGERGNEAHTDPTTASGALAQWFGDKENDWEMVRRNQFTEVTGPGGIYGNDKPESDPLWAMGWDARSLILALLENKEWHYYRLPKGSHSYDGAHGWNTEWPRIREIGEENLLATMHGTFWNFPSGFSVKNSSGISPRSNYLKVIGDFCRWKDKVVFGCDDSAKSEFLNTRHFKAKHGAGKQSNSNLWFVDPAQIDHFGPAIGRGSVWLREDVTSGQISDPYLFSGYDHRQLFLSGKSNDTFTLEIDREGNNTWEALREITIPEKGSQLIIFEESDHGTWVRLKSHQDSTGITAHFQYRNTDDRTEENDPVFAGISTVGEKSKGGLMQSLSYERMGIVATDLDGKLGQFFDINQKLEITPSDDTNLGTKITKEVMPPDSTFKVDEASVILIEGGKQYRLPKNDAYRTDTPVARSGKKLLDFLDQSVAIGSRATVASTHSSYEASYAVDGIIQDDDKRWIGESGAWIEIDLGSEKKLSEIWVITGWKGETTYAANSFDILTKQNGEWVKQTEVEKNSDIEFRHQLETPVQTQFIRVQSNDSSYFRVYEVAAFEEKLDIEDKPLLAKTPRVCREVATERDLLNLHGTFYELPARNAQGLAKVRPVSTHNLAIHDFCSHNGLLFFTGLDSETTGDHIFRSEDGKAAVWAGVVDDLWKLGKPRGKGGPWKNTKVKAGKPSDPYLMTAYDKKSVTIESTSPTSITLEVDIDGTDLWIPYQSFDVAPENTVEHQLPDGFSAYWIRAVSKDDSEVTVQFEYR